MVDEYKKMAYFYDYLLFFAMLPFRNEIKKVLKNDKNKKILDLCCGTGNQLKILNKNGFTNLHCLDISEAMLSVADSGKYSDYEIYHRDATATNFPDESFDIILLSFAIHEKDEIVRNNMLKEAYRILKEDGKLIITDYIFTKRSFFLAKWVITLIEKIAGKEHYKNFKSYNKLGGLNNLISKTEFIKYNETIKVFNTIGIFYFKK